MRALTALATRWAALPRCGAARPLSAALQQHAADAFSSPLPLPRVPSLAGAIGGRIGGPARQGRSKDQQKNGFDLVVFSNSRGCEFEAVVKKDGDYCWRAGVLQVARNELQASESGREVIATIPGKQLQFSVARAVEGGVCTGYTLSNEMLKKLGFRVAKWKHVTPLPADKDAAAKHEDAIAWVDMMEEE